MPKLIVVSNRLPVSLSPAGELTRSSGGLVSALSSLSTPFLWVGSLGSGGSVDEAAKASLAASGCLAVEMPEKVYEAYYVSAPSPRRYRSAPSARAPSLTCTSPPPHPPALRQ
jgi:trehalose-6-phosphate synthase